jgi:hypothetical protein
MEDGDDKVESVTDAIAAEYAKLFQRHAFMTNQEDKNLDCS